MLLTSIFPDERALLLPGCVHWTILCRILYGHCRCILLRLVRLVRGLDRWRHIPASLAAQIIIRHEWWPQACDGGNLVLNVDGRGGGRNGSVFGDSNGGGAKFALLFGRGIGLSSSGGLGHRLGEEKVGGCAGTESTAHVGRNIRKPDLIRGIHPPKTFSRDKLEVNAHIAILDLDLMGEGDNVKLLWDDAVKVHKSLGNAVLVMEHEP